jgi:transcriptional regulator with XRE-family HTH domain
MTVDIEQPSLPHRNSPRETTDVDRKLGVAIQLRRKERGVTQEALAEAIGVTFQQVQKYERGYNRLSVAAFLKVCVALGCHPSELLGITQAADAPSAISREGMRLLILFEAIEAPEIRAHAIKLFEAIVGRSLME